jgi:hypothetical protein
MIETINLGLSIVLFFLGAGIAVAFRNSDMELLKAKMFLKRGLIKRMWIYSSLAGGLVVLHQIFSFFGFGVRGYEMLMTALLLSFILLGYSWYTILRESVRK